MTGQEERQGIERPLARLVFSILARIMHETPSRNHGDGRATGQPQGLGPEAYLLTTPQGSRPEDAQKDSHIRVVAGGSGIMRARAAEGSESL
jgi:hypothetical protein